MSEPQTSRSAGKRTPRIPAGPSPAVASTPAAACKRNRAADEIAALLRLAELDARLLECAGGGQAPVDDEVADERHGLGARISADLLEAYDRSLRAGRRPAVVRLQGSVCSGCHMRLHSKLEHQVHVLRGLGACPHCLRLVYDPTWLAS